MRTTGFGDPVVESVDDDLGLIAGMMVVAPEDLYAIVLTANGKYYFEVLRNDDGELIAMSDPIFDTKEAAKAYVEPYVSEVQFY